MATAAPAAPQQQPPFELRWLVRVPDHNTAESREKRASLMAQHKGRLMVFKKESPGTIQYGGPTLDEETQKPTGSFFVMRHGLGGFATSDEIRAWIEKDAYYQNGVWSGVVDIQLYQANTRPKAENEPY